MNKRPENYKWCSLYLRMNDPVDASEWLYPVTRQDIIDNPRDDEPVPFLNLADKISELDWYRMFVYISASTERKGTASLDTKAVNEMIKFAGYMGAVDQFSKRIKNFTDGIVIGTPKKVETFQLAIFLVPIGPLGNWIYPNWSKRRKRLRQAISFRAPVALRQSQ